MPDGGYYFDGFIRSLVKETVTETLTQFLRAGDGTPVKRRLYTVEESAVYMGRTLEAMQHMISAGKIPTVRMDRRVFIDVRDLDRLIENSKACAMLKRFRIRTCRRKKTRQRWHWASWAANRAAKHE